MFLRLHRIPGAGDGFAQRLRREGGFDPGPIETEYCFYIQTNSDLDNRGLGIIKKYLTTTYLPDGIAGESFLQSSQTVLEIGPRMNFQTVPSSTTVSVFTDCGLSGIERVERSIRIGLSKKISEEEAQVFLAPLFKKMIFDKMTQERYFQPLTTFETGIIPEPVQIIPLMENGIEALVQACGKKGMGLSLDEQDLEYAYALFHDRLGRNPTDVEMFLFGQEWSEHCGHPYWNGLRIIDGVPSPMTLMEYAKAPWKTNPNNSLVGFGDESSAFQGLRPVVVLVSENPGHPSRLVPMVVMLHPATSAESHCHPSKKCPRAGAATGVAVVRDAVDVGRGAEMGISFLGIAVGNLCIPGYLMPWENPNWQPIGAVPALEIAREGRLGAFGFGNALGQPVPGGWFISFGLNPGDGERSYPKPIIYIFTHSLIREEHLYKQEPEKGMILVQWGGPAYPIGVGGGSRSSSSAGLGDDLTIEEELDFNSVQRGAPEMQQRGVRVTRACIEMGDKNPIITTKDLGAGGDITAVTEIGAKTGLKVELRDIPSGDKTMSVRVYMGNEAQERSIAAIRPDSPVFPDICERERCPFAKIGEFTGDGQLIVHDSEDDTTPINLPGDAIFAKKPQKVFQLETVIPKRNPLVLPKDLTILQVADRVLRHPTVACKGWLTNHVDRSVGARTVLQSCLGPYHLPVADCSIMAISFLDTIGTASAIGVQPHIGLISAPAMARMTLTEALLNLSGAVISNMADIKCEVNWFAAAKERGEGVIIDQAARELAEAEIMIGMAQLGGKDSSSLKNLMINPSGQTVDVKAPVTLVVAVSAQMPDMTKFVTPVIKGDTLIHVDLSPEKKPLGASILSQVFGQTGNDCADVKMKRVIHCEYVTQKLIREGLITSLHDISDGGLFTTLVEMASVSGVGLYIDTQGKFGWLKHYFSQVPGNVICCKRENAKEIIASYQCAGVDARMIGILPVVSFDTSIRIYHNNNFVMNESMLKLRKIWLETSFRIDEMDADPACIEEERQTMATLLKSPPFHLTATHKTMMKEIRFPDRPKAVVLRAPGSNGDRDLAGMAYRGGFDPLEVITTDLMAGKVNLDDCRAAFQAGGFSYQDEPLEAGVGWAASMEENPNAWEQYRNFYFERQDTLSYHPCNGTQVATILGIVPDQTLPREKRPRFLQNKSGMFESRFPAVKIMPSPAIMFQGMENSILGIIVCHGEGQLFCPDPEILDWILAKGLAPLRYVNPSGEIADTYPLNPNGSPYGIAGLCTVDGRHVVTMPHIERLFEPWHWPWMPKSWRRYKISPWLPAVQNMCRWCLDNKTL